MYCVHGKPSHDCELCLLQAQAIQQNFYDSQTLERLSSALRRQHGGQRSGAGRPAKYSEPLRQITVRVTSDQLDVLKTIAATPSEAVRSLIDRLR